MTRKEAIDRIRNKRDWRAGFYFKSSGTPSGKELREIEAFDLVIRAAEEGEALKLVMKCYDGTCWDCVVFEKCGGVPAYYELRGFCQHYQKHMDDWIEAWRRKAESETDETTNP